MEKSKYIIGLSFLLLLTVDAWSQITTDLYTIGAAGGTTTINGGNSYSYNVGGLVMETSVTSGNTYTQGFEQPTVTVSLIDFKPPNAFSPDGDGVNETWIIPLEMLTVENTVTIFNRWGDIITTIENYNNLDNVWDGSHENNSIQVVKGTYFYVVESPNSTEKYSGWIQVVR